MTIVASLGRSYRYLDEQPIGIHFCPLPFQPVSVFNEVSALKIYELPMQENGRVVLPSELRRVLGLAKGDKVLIEAEGDHVTLTTARLRRKRAQAIAKRYAQPGVSVVEEFLSEKRAEARQEIDRITPDDETAEP